MTIGAEIALVTACWLAHREAKKKAAKRGPYVAKHAAPVVLRPWSPSMKNRPPLPPRNRMERAA